MSKRVGLAVSALGLCLMGASLTVSASAIEDKYNTTCFACHGTGAAGAPVAHDAKAWSPRLEKGMDVLVGSVKRGMGAMPPNGLCNDCSDEQFKGLIEFMVQ
ncbi:MAG: cytochrome c5 family protein [Gammaproteobacteria bacterium]|nr:MAG: cytochrome c5 family protein [Gammaproteobacteria bacterium]